MISITKIFGFEAAHAISNHPGKCRNVHGHSYALHVTISSDQLNEQEMIMDFHDLKVMVKEHVVGRLDHALILSRKGELAEEFANHTGKLTWLDREPTAECMLSLIVEWISPVLPESITLERLQLWETTTSYAQWDRDQAH
ncbi:MAG: 6-carboxytetrahydropterin synthase QueD [Flavobacteriales bacterium]|nr:6-carboxytetrahydropterin synthase QueD [Flavobacteriales bacterium]